MPHHTSVKPPWAALQAFVSVAQQGSAAGAAEALGVTPSAVSHQLAILESCLGAQLLDRSARPMQFTALGQSYAQRLIPGFDLIQDATSALFPKRMPSQCFVTSHPLLIVKWLLPALAARPPDGLSIRPLATNRVLDLRCGEADMAVRLGEPKASPGYEVVSLITDSVVAVCAPAVLKGRRPALSKLIASTPLIVTDPSGRLWRAWLRTQGLSAPQPLAGPCADDALAALEVACAGGGIALCLESMVRQDLASARLVQLVSDAAPATLQHHIVVHVDALARPAVRAALQWLVDVASGHTDTPALP